MVNPFGQQADTLCMAAADEVAETAGEEHRPEVTRLYPRLLEQDGDTGADGPGT